MDGFLKQSTAATVKVGPFLDATDGVTPETGLASNGTEISKAGGAYGTGPTLGTHDAEGEYPVSLTTSHTDTLGILKLKSFDSSTHLPVWHTFQVVPANVYDSQFAGTDKLEVDVVELGGVAQSATDLKDFADAGYDPSTNKVQGVVLVDTTTTNSDMRGTDSAALASVATEARLAELDAANLPSDVDAILADTGTDGVVVAAGSKSGYSLSSAGVQAIWDALTSALTTASSIGKLLVDNINATISSRASQTSVDDVPTTAEFEARTLVAADYFDPAADTVATVTDVTNQVTADVTAISGDSTAADRLEALMDASPLVQVNGVATTTSIPIDGFTSTRDDQFNGRLLTVGDGSFEQTDITDYDHATKTLTVTALSAAPADNAFLSIS